MAKDKTIKREITVGSTYIVIDPETEIYKKLDHLWEPCLQDVTRRRKCQKSQNQ